MGSVLARRSSVIVALLLLWWSASVAAQGGWSFLPAPEGPSWGPVVVARGESARLNVGCLRYGDDTLSTPEDELPPRRLELWVDWIRPDPGNSEPDSGDSETGSGDLETDSGDLEPVVLKGGSTDPRSAPSTEIIWRVDRNPEVREKWVTRLGFQQELADGEALRFVDRLLPPARALTISADFSDGSTLAQTFSLPGFDAAVAKMLPDCEALLPLLWNEP